MAELSGGRVSCPTWRVLRGVGQDSPFQSLLHHDYPSANCQKWRVYSVYIYELYTRFSDTLICQIVRFSNLLSKTGTVVLCPPCQTSFNQEFMAHSQASGCGQAVNGNFHGNFHPIEIIGSVKNDWFIMLSSPEISRHFFQTKRSPGPASSVFSGDLLATDGMRKAPSGWTKKPSFLGLPQNMFTWFFSWKILSKMDDIWG